MGKGDRRTRRGKIAKGTFGVRRKHKNKSPKPPLASKAGSKQKKKAPAKKKVEKEKNVKAATVETPQVENATKTAPDTVKNKNDDSKNTKQDTKAKSDKKGKADKKEGSGDKQIS